MTEHAEKSREEQFAEYVESTDAAEREQAESNAANDAGETIAQPVVAEVAQPAPVAQEAKPTDEPFPGFAQLPADVQETVRKRLGASEEAERRANDLKRQHDAMQGRLAPTQRELAEAQRRLREMQNAGRPDPRQSVDRLRDIDPDTHQAVHAVQEQLAETRAQLAQMNEFVERAQVREYESDQLTALRQAHPDVTEIAQSPEFNAWCAALPAKQQERLLARDADNTAMVIEDYKRDLALAQLLVEREQTQSQAATAAPAKPATPKRGLAVDPNPSTRRSAVATAAVQTFASEKERDFAEYMALNPG